MTDQKINRYDLLIQLRERFELIRYTCHEKKNKNDYEVIKQSAHENDICIYYVEMEERVFQEIKESLQKHLGDKIID